MNIYTHVLEFRWFMEKNSVHTKCFVYVWSYLNKHSYLYLVSLTVLKSLHPSSFGASNKNQENISTKLLLVFVLFHPFYSN